MEVLQLIKECIHDCSEIILKKIEESDTVIDDMLLEKLLWFLNYLKARF
jgi:hypothetical protein